TTVIW
ncbi:molybdopterin dinucleotide binding domain protein, partial [Vibrio parahaemolyticus V-223/04]